MQGRTLDLCPGCLHLLGQGWTSCCLGRVLGSSTGVLQEVWVPGVDPDGVDGDAFPIILQVLFVAVVSVLGQFWVLTDFTFGKHLMNGVFPLEKHFVTVIFLLGQLSGSVPNGQIPPLGQFLLLLSLLPGPVPLSPLDCSLPLLWEQFQLPPRGEEELCGAGKEATALAHQGLLGPGPRQLCSGLIPAPSAPSPSMAACHLRPHAQPWLLHGRGRVRICLLQEYLHYALL